MFEPPLRQPDAQSAASFRGGGSAPAVQALAGHLHLTTTERYAQMVQRDLRATIALLDRRGSSVLTPLGST